ncbi:hypothetical protein [Streptomyces griseus]|uniref:hypothetical protein n=1 Tax=Streptomyces griseus TaxID=1911 RepID=UPI0037925AAA
MTETLTPPTTDLAPGSPLAVLFGFAAVTARLDSRLTADEERDSAETAAADHVYTAYPSTLDRALDDDAWTGHPVLRDDAVQPSAVAHLDGGLWLHHTITADADYRDVLTLIVPCACGRGYVTTLVEDEDDLLDLLQELRLTGGRSAHGGDAGGPHCASAPVA